MHQLRVAIVPAYLLLCLVLGGASAAGIWSNMLLQLLAIPLLAAALLARPSTPMSAAGRQLIALALLAVAIIVVQLIPLPPALWTPLPGREQVAAGFAALGQPLPWMPLSLAPHRTISSALWLLPAFATLLAILRLRAFKPNLIAWVVIGVTSMSVAIGALQVAAGQGSPWYFYAITNYGVSTGFFANANHFATLLFCTFPFLTALYLQARRKGRSMQRASGLLVILVGAVAVVFVGLAVNRSIAGLGLAVPVLAACAVMIASRNRRVPLWAGAVVALLVLASVGAAFSAPFGNNLTSEAGRGSEGSRYTSFSLSLAAAADYAPVGSGIGSFQEIYPTYENPATILPTYMNHVHGDYIELALETGAIGLIAIIIFLIWWARRTIAIWTSDDRDYFALAATIASAGILAHSLVDYPLRTAAIAALFAVCCALMADVRAAGRARRREDADESAPRTREARHLSAD